MENNDITYLLKREKDLEEKLEELRNKKNKTELDKVIYEETLKYLARIRTRKNHGN